MTRTRVPQQIIKPSNEQVKQIPFIHNSFPQRLQAMEWNGSLDNDDFDTYISSFSRNPAAEDEEFETTEANDNHPLNNSNNTEENVIPRYHSLPENQINNRGPDNTAPANYNSRFKANIDSFSSRSKLDPRKDSTTDFEELLAQQEQFLNSGASPSAKVIKYSKNNNNNQNQGILFSSLNNYRYICP